jgi:DNA repair protein RecO (recombination protein O)
MPVQEAEAIVLRQYPLSDSDRIVVFATREFGKIRAAAKGARKPQSRMAGCLEPLSHIRVEFYAREGSDLAQVRRTELIHSYLGHNPDLKRVAAFSYFAEIANELVQDYQSNFAMFRLLLAVLDAGSKHGINLALVLYFEFWCLKLSGFFPNYAYCSSCGKCVKNHGFYVWLDAGQARCGDCALGRGIKIGALASAALSQMATLPPDQFMVSPFDEEASREIERLAQRLLSLHLDRPLKSYRILNESLDAS